MVTIDIKINPDGRIYLPTTVRDKLAADTELVGFSVRGTVLIVPRNMDLEFVQSCFKVMLDEFSLEKKDNKTKWNK